MALNNLTNQNIQDTFQKVVQTDGTNLADGTGSLLPISFDGDDVIILGSLTATAYSISSSVVDVQVATLSGSTNFGNSADDTHNFEGISSFRGTVKVSGSRYYTSGSASNQLLGLAVTGSILPGITSDGDTGFDLGSPTAVWRDLWLSENSVKFVSSSGEVTRFSQEDAKALREGKPLRQETAIGGTDRIVRAQAIYHETDNEHYIKQTEAGVWNFIGPGGNILNIDARDDNHIISTGGVISGGELRIQDQVIKKTNNVLNVPGAGFFTTAITASNLTTTGNINAGGELTGIIRGGTF
tara:strand:- start:243 stop:1136 length:894 start_codon:yes stop_codon:yes gene_type:complete